MNAVLNYVQMRRHLALQASFVMYEGHNLPDRRHILLNIYAQATKIERSITFSFSDERGNTISYLSEIRSVLISKYKALNEAQYIQSVIEDKTVHSLCYEEVIVNRISLMMMEWPDDERLQSLWDKCPINWVPLTHIMESIWPWFATFSEEIIAELVNQHQQHEPPIASPKIATFDGEVA